MARIRRQRDALRENLTPAKSEEMFFLEEVSGDWSEVRRPVVTHYDLKASAVTAWWANSMRASSVIWLHQTCLCTFYSRPPALGSVSRSQLDRASGAADSQPQAGAQGNARDGLRTWRSGPFCELMLRTKSFEVLDVLLSYGDPYVSFWTWIIDSDEAEFPTDHLRHLNFDREEPTLTRETLARHLGVVRLEEFHGPVELTRFLTSDRILGTAKRTAPTGVPPCASPHLIVRADVLPAKSN